jgi:hypothetical protein
MTGLGSSEELGPIAVAVDEFLKEREDDSNSIPGPIIEHPHLPDRQGYGVRGTCPGSMMKKWDG